MTPESYSGTPRKRSSQKGNAMVEFALAATLLVPCFVGIFQFGYGFFVYNRMVAGVRTGARYASLLKYTSASEVPAPSYKDAVSNMSVYGDPAGGTTPIVPGLTPGQISVTMGMVEGAPDMVTVAVSNYSVDVVFKVLEWANKPAASFRYAGVYSPQ